MDATRSTGFKTLAVLPRVCEKSSASSALGRDQQDADTPARSSTAATGVELLCQEETRRFDPFWDGPRLLPTFVAQVIGQAIPDRRDHAMSLQTAYGSIDCPRKALVLDRRS